MIDPSTRLRRAIHLNDPLLVRRLIRTHPHLLRNPDFTDKSNTSLHLAASHGSTEIASRLIAAGHDATETSRNTDHDTPLMLAARAGHVDVAKLLVAHFPRCVGMRNRAGLDALAIAAQQAEATGLLPVLLDEGGNAAWAAEIDGRDLDGNTALHHASASGSLKALRILLTAGADPLARNSTDWTPLAYSQTVAAEVYFKNLVAEFERRKVEGLKVEEERERQRAAGMRVVTTADEGGSTGSTPVKRQQGVLRGESGSQTPVDEEESISDALKIHWGPVMGAARPGTPSGGRREWDGRPTAMRTQSANGE